MKINVVHGDLLDQPTDAIVNAWNQNIIPWFLLLPHGVSGAIKKRAGLKPFCELGLKGPLALGQAVATSAGRLPYKYIIHVAGISWYWMASEDSITRSVQNSILLAEKLQLRSIALPILGSGVGGFAPEKAEALMRDTAQSMQVDLALTLVRYRA